MKPRRRTVTPSPRALVIHASLDTGTALAVFKFKLTLALAVSLALAPQQALALSPQTSVTCLGLRVGLFGHWPLQEQPVSPA